MRQTCVILAGGLGTRLRSEVADLPKCLAPINGRPFLDIQIETLAAAGVDDFVLSLGYMADKVVKTIRPPHSGVTIRHVIERELLGTGGAIAHVQDELQLDEVLVANGDTFLDGDISAMLQPLAREQGEQFRLAVVTVLDRARFGGVACDPAMFVSHFLEKGQHGPGAINAGLYRLCRSALPSHRVGAYSLEADVLPGLVSARHVTACELAAAFIDIGVPEDYRRFCSRHDQRLAPRGLH